MRTWLRHHAQALALAARKLAAQRASGLLNALVIGIALALPAGGQALLADLESITGNLALEPQVSVFMRRQASPAEVEAVGRALRADTRLAGVRHVPREEALKELQATDGLAEVIAALGHNPLPDAFVLRASRSGATSVDALAAELRKLSGVAHVQADSAWARRLGALAATGRLALMLVGTLLALGLVAITFNTIRLQILTQRDEIEVSKLIGASDSFIRRPYYYLGALQGLAGGLLALLILAGSLSLLNRGVRDLAATFGSSFQLGFLAPGDALGVALFSAALGWFGAYLSVSKYLREIEPK